MRRLNKKGFTLIEMLLAFLLISSLVIWAVNAVPNIQSKSKEEDNRLLAIMRNVDIIEMTRADIARYGEAERMSPNELNGEDYGEDVFYGTFYNRFEKSSDDGTYIKNLLDSALNYPEAEEFKPKEGSTSELYYLEVDTTVAQKVLKSTTLKTFVYRTNVVTGP